MPTLIITYKKKIPGPDDGSIDKIVGKKHVATRFGCGFQDVEYIFRSYADARIAMRSVIAARKNHEIYLPGLFTAITKTIRGEDQESYVLTYEGRKMGTIEPIFLKSQPVRKEHDAADHLAFIRGCIRKYRGNKGISDKDILDYMEYHL